MNLFNVYKFKTHYENKKVKKKKKKQRLVRKSVMSL